MNQLIGYEILVLMFVGIFVAVAWSAGWRVAVGAFAATAVVGTLIYLATWLIDG